jgi:hypothetical protein
VIVLNVVDDTFVGLLSITENANTNVTVLVLTQRGIQPTNVSSTTFKTITKDIRETVLMVYTVHKNAHN